MPAGKILQLSRSISVETVHGSRYKHGGAYAAQPIDNKKEQDHFLGVVKSAFKKLTKLPTGRRLVAEMDGSGHTCVIFRGDEFNGGAAIMQDTGNIRATLERYALPLSDYGTMLISDDFDTTAVDPRTEIPKRVGAVRDYYDGQFTDTEIDMRTNNYVFQTIYNRIERKHQDALTFMSRTTGVSRQKIDAYRFGEERITTSDNFRLSLGLYNWLIPGVGADTAVRLTPGIGIKSDNKVSVSKWLKGKSQYDLDVDAVRADIMLGHELVHAWRMMTGMRIVAKGWEEEMMTVGLGPGAWLPYTENKLRMEAGHPLRTSYNLSPSTTAGSNIKMSMDATVIS